MKLSVNQQDLLRATTRAHSIVKSGGTYDIEEYVLVEASENRLSLRTTSGQLEVIATAPAEVSVPGGTVVKSALLDQIARRIPGSAAVEIVMTREPQRKDGARDDTNADAGAADGSATLDPRTEQVQRLQLLAGKSVFSLETRPAQDFPQQADEEYKSKYQVPASDLMLLFEKTYRAISKDETRFYLAGVFLHATKDDESCRLIAVATDGHRLMKASVPADSEVASIDGVILPEGTVTVLRQSLEKVDEVEVSISENKARFAVANFTLVSPTISGTYPDYNRVIPTGYNISAEIDTSVLGRSLNRVNAVADSPSERVTLELSAKSVQLSVRTYTGSSRDEIPITYNGPEMKFALYGNHLNDILSQFEGDTLGLELRDDKSPLVVAEHIEEAIVTYVMVPHRA